MRTTLELPDDLMVQVRVQAESSGLTMRALMIEALELRLAQPRRVRRPPPAIGKPGSPPMDPLTREQIDEATFG